MVALVLVTACATVELPTTQGELCEQNARARCEQAVRCGESTSDECFAALMLVCCDGEGRPACDEPFESEVTPHEKAECLDRVRECECPSDCGGCWG